MTPYTIEQFGPLNLTADPLDVGASGARNLKNVRLDSPGRVKARGGFDTLNSTTQTSVLGFYRFRNLGGTPNAYLAIRSGSLRWYDPGLATHVDFVSPTHFATSVFSGSALELNDGTGDRFVVGRTNTTLLFVTGSGLSPISGSPNTTFLTLSGLANRIVAAYAGNGILFPDRVHFSAPGDPSTWNLTDDFVDIWRGDSQQIRAAVTYRDNVFVFKDRRFAVFYGESIDADGGAIFNYRPVDVGIGCAYDFGAVVGPDGVYFISTDGIYRTQGDAPTLISGAIQPVFDGETDGDWTGPTAIVSPRLYAAQDRLYFVNDGKVFTYHYASGAWTLDVYTPGVQILTQTPTDKVRSVYFIDGTGKACEAGDTFADDDGSPIAWSYKSGRYPLADAGTVAVSVQSSVVGSGTVALRLDSDLYSNQNGSATLGTAPATAEGWPAAVDQEGTWLQHTLSGTGAATVSRLTHFVTSVKPVGVR